MQLTISIKHDKLTKLMLTHVIILEKKSRYLTESNLSLFSHSA